MLQKEVSERLARAGISTEASRRYGIDWASDEDDSVESRGCGDLERLCRSEILVTCSDSEEMNAGSAAIQGLAAALGKKILLYNSKATNMVGDNRYRSSRNLMVDYSANVAVSALADIEATVRKLLGGG